MFSLYVDLERMNRVYCRNSIISTYVRVFFTLAVKIEFKDYSITAICVCPLNHMLCFCIANLE